MKNAISEHEESLGRVNERLDSLLINQHMRDQQEEASSVPIILPLHEVATPRKLAVLGTSESEESPTGLPLQAVGDQERRPFINEQLNAAVVEDLKMIKEAIPQSEIRMQKQVQETLETFEKKLRAIQV